MTSSPASNGFVCEFLTQDTSFASSNATLRRRKPSLPRVAHGPHAEFLQRGDLREGIALRPQQHAPGTFDNSPARVLSLGPQQGFLVCSTQGQHQAQWHFTTLDDGTARQVIADGVGKH